MLKNNILTLSDNWDSHWTMIVDLKEIIKDTGRKQRNPETGKMETLFTLIQAKKLIKLILQYASSEELVQLDILFKDNDKLYKVWKEKYG